MKIDGIFHQCLYILSVKKKGRLSLAAGKNQASVPCILRPGLITDLVYLNYGNTVYGIETLKTWLRQSVHKVYYQHPLRYQLYFKQGTPVRFILCAGIGVNVP